MASGLNEEHVEKKLMAVTNTQDSIQGLSLWIIHHKSHHSRIVELWAKVLKKTVKPSHRLTLYYLCNDVVQNCKRKKAVVYVDTFKKHLLHGTALVRDLTIKPKIARIFNIWEERQVFDKDFVADLRSVLDGKRADGVFVKSHKEAKEVAATPPVTPAEVFDEIQPPDPTLEMEAEKEETKEKEPSPDAEMPTPEILAEFKPQEMVEKIRVYKRQEGDVEVKVRQLAHLKLDASSIEAVKQLKDRAHGNEFSNHFEESCLRLEEASICLEKKRQEQKDLIAQLRISEYFYDEQYREARIVANAYKNFGSRINTMKRRLDELKRSLPSPIPSPTPDAPSPGATPPHLQESDNQPVDMDLDQGDEGVAQPEDDDIPSPPDEAPSPVSSPGSPSSESKGGSSSLDNRLASFIPSLQSKKGGKDHPIPVYVPQPLKNSSSDSSRRASANKTLTESDMPFPEEEGGSTPLTDERPSTPVLDEGPSVAALPPPPPLPPPPSSHSSGHEKSGKKKKENPMDFLSRLILSQTQSKPAGSSSSFLEGFSQLTTKVKEHMEATKSNGSPSDVSPISLIGSVQAPKSWAAWKAQTAEKVDDVGDGAMGTNSSMPVPNFAMPPPPPPVPPPVLRPGVAMPPPHMPPPMGSPPAPFFQHTSPGQKENWPDGPGDEGEGGRDASPSMMYPSGPGDVPPPPFPPSISKPQSSQGKGMMRKSGGHSVLKELTRSDDASPSIMPPPPPPPPPPHQSPMSSAPIPVSISQPKFVDQPPSSSVGMDMHQAQEFIEKLKRKTMVGVGSHGVGGPSGSSYAPNPVRPNLMTLTPGSDGDEGMGEMDMDLDDQEEEEEEEEEGAPQGPAGRPKGIPVLSSVVRRVDPSEKQSRDDERSKDHDGDNHERSHDSFHKDRHYGRRSPDFYPPNSEPSPSNFDYRDDRFYGYGSSQPPYFDQYPPNPSPSPQFYGGNQNRDFPFRPKRPYGNRGGYSRRPNFHY